MDKGLGSADAVLDFIFNPAGMPSSVPKGPLPDMPAITADKAKIDRDGDFPINEEGRRLQVEGVKAAQQGDIPAAIKHFSAALTANPENPLLLNDRAQALRDNENYDDSQKDIDAAVALMESKYDGKRPVDWPLQSRVVRSQLMMQQASLYKRRDANETKAREQMERAAALGNPLAQGLLEETNPYAALCGAAVTKMMAEQIAGADASPAASDLSAAASGGAAEPNDGCK